MSQYVDSDWVSPVCEGDHPRVQQGDHGAYGRGDALEGEPVAPELSCLPHRRVPSTHPTAAVDEPEERSGQLLLAAKLAVPLVRPGTLPRLHLREKLDLGVRRRLTLVAAAAGWGKTTLASAWLARQRSPVAWVTLDAADNDPIRWLTYVLTALNHAAPGCGTEALALLDADRPPALETVIARTLNAVARLAEPVILALDDYHVITADSVHAAVRRCQLIRLG